MSPEEFLRAYEASTGRHGLPETLELIEDHAVYWFSNGGAHAGKAAIERALRDNFETIKEETYRIGPIRWLVSTEEVAVGIYRFEWSGLIQGEPASGRGRGTSVLARTPQGSWRVVHEHLSQGDPGFGDQSG